MTASKLRVPGWEGIVDWAKQKNLQHAFSEVKGSVVKPEQKPPSLPSPKSPAKTPAQAQVNLNHTYHITQQPGESGQNLAERIAYHVSQQRISAGRSALYDGVV